MDQLLKDVQSGDADASFTSEIMRIMKEIQMSVEQTGICLPGNQFWAIQFLGFRSLAITNIIRALSCTGSSTKHLKDGRLFQVETSTFLAVSLLRILRWGHF